MQVIELDEYLRRIDSLTDNGKLEHAAFHCLYLLRQFPKMFRLYEKIGRIYSEMDNINGVLNIYLRLCSVQPENYLYHIPLMYSYAECKQQKEAVDHCQMALCLQPGNQSVAYELSCWIKKNNIYAIIENDISTEFTTGLQKFRKKDFAGAILHFIKSRKMIFFNLSSLYLGLSYCYIHAEEKGIPILENVVKREPYNITALQTLCSYYSIHDQIRFSHYLDKLIDLDPFYNHWEIQSNHICAQYDPIYITFYEWTGTPKNRGHIGWQHSNEKLIMSDNSRLPEWLELLPVSNDFIPALENDAESVSGNFYNSSYFSHIVSASNSNEQMQSLSTNNSMENATSSELEQAFTLLKQVASDGLHIQKSDEDIIRDIPEEKEPFHSEQVHENGIMECTEPAPQIRMQMRNAWSCFSKNDQEKGIQLYRELIEQKECLEKIKSELQELSILFPDNQNLLDLLQSIS